MTEYQIFLSFKHSDFNGNVTKDAVIAKNLYDHFTARGKKVFFSDVTLTQIGESEFKRTIDAALDSATVLIVICTDPRYVVTRWVEYEWDTFSNDILSNFKPNGKIYSVIDGVNPRDLPRTLRNRQLFFLSTDGYGNIVNYVCNYLDNVDDEPVKMKNYSLKLNDSGKFMLNYKDNKKVLKEIYRDKENFRLTVKGTDRCLESKLTTSISLLLQKIRNRDSRLGALFFEYCGIDGASNTPHDEETDEIALVKWLNGCSKVLSSIINRENASAPD